MLPLGVWRLKQSPIISAKDRHLRGIDRIVGVQRIVTCTMEIIHGVRQEARVEARRPGEVLFLRSWPSEKTSARMGSRREVECNRMMS